MSNNIHLVAKRDITFRKGDGTMGSEVQEVMINVWQTPSDVTREIIDSANPIQAYKDWVVSIGHDKEEPIFASDDIFGEGEPIGTKIVNEALNHVGHITADIEALERQGFTIEAEAW